MTPRPPLVVGLHRGAGASTVAAALHAHDDRLCSGWLDRNADIVVCGSDDASLALADALVLASTGPRPLLAVTAGTAVPPRVRLRALEERFGTVVLLPDVARWHGLVRPLDDVGTLLAQPVEHLSRPMRSYASAMRHLAAAVLRSGQLDRDLPPFVGAQVPTTGRTAPVGLRAVEPWKGPEVEVRAQVRPVLISAPRPVHPVLVEPRRTGRMSYPEILPNLTERSAGALPVHDLDLNRDLDLDLDDEELEAAAWCSAGQAG